MSEATKMEGLRAALAEQFPSVAFRIVDYGVPSILVPAEHLLAVCEHLKTAPGLEFEVLASETAIDYLDRIDLVYQLRSLKRHADCVLRVEIDRDESTAPAVTSVWPAANLQEREIYDLMGVRFVGHPDLRRILLYDEFDGHPLRKDWRLPAEPRELARSANPPAGGRRGH